MHDKTDRQPLSPRVVAVAGGIAFPPTRLLYFAAAVNAAVRRARAAGLIPPPLASSPDGDRDVTSWRAQQLAARYRLSGSYARAVADLAFQVEATGGQR